MYGESIKVLVRLTIAVTSFIILLAVAFGAGVAVDRLLLPHEAGCAGSEAAVEAFYAGAYAVCYETTNAPTVCDKVVRYLYHNELPSPGFRWPPLPLEPEPTPDDG